MAKIKIHVFDSVKGGLNDMELPDTVTGEQIINAMIDKGKLPRVDDQGNPIVHELISGMKDPGGAKKITTKTLEQAGVKDGDQLIVRQTIIAA